MLRSNLHATSARVLGLLLGLASVPACSERGHSDVVTLDTFELRTGEPRDIRWQLCKEGRGLPELFNAQLHLELVGLGSVQVLAWPSQAAHEANEAPVPLHEDPLVAGVDAPELELEPEAAFELDGRQCTGNEFLRIELVSGTEVTLDATFDAHVIDFDQVVDRLILEAELLP